MLQSSFWDSRSDPENFFNTYIHLNPNARGAFFHSKRTSHISNSSHESSCGINNEMKKNVDPTVFSHQLCIIFQTCLGRCICSNVTEAILTHSTKRPWILHERHDGLHVTTQACSLVRTLQVHLHILTGQGQGCLWQPLHIFQCLGSTLYKINQSLQGNHHGANCGTETVQASLYNCQLSHARALMLDWWLLCESIEKHGPMSRYILFFSLQTYHECLRSKHVNRYQTSRKRFMHRKPMRLTQEFDNAFCNLVLCISLRTDYLYRSILSSCEVFLASHVCLFPTSLIFCKFS